MATRTIDQSSSLRPGLELALLFAASFAVTLWKVHPALSRPPFPTGDASLAAQLSIALPAMNGVTASRVLPLAGPVVIEPASSAPSLQDLAIDTDPAVRGEAQALIGLLDLEPIYD